MPRAETLVQGMSRCKRCPARWRRQSWLLFVVFLVGICAWSVVASRVLEAQQANDTPEAHDTQAERTLWTCSMHPQVIRDAPGNCPICGMQLTPLQPRRAGATPATPGERKVKYWWDPMMNPPYISDRPGKSPMGMDLVPVYEDEVVAGQVITIDPRLAQNMGVQLAEVRRGTLTRTVRTYAEVREPSATVQDITVRFGAWVVRLFASYEGMHVAKGAPIFELYSPELQTALAEWIAAQSAAKENAELLAATRGKLEQLGLNREQIEEFASREEAPRTVVFHATHSFHVVEKLVNEGARVEPGQSILRVNDRTRMWLDALVYEQDLPFIRLGQQVEARVLALPGRVYRGTVTFIHPHVEPMARTIVVRAELENEQGELRQGMAATAVISGAVLTDALLVPREAVIETGERKVVFVATEPGHFEPRTVETGPPGADGVVSVVQGLAPGERVVVSGQFLLDAESRLREAARKFLGTSPPEGVSHGAHSH